MHAGFSFSHSPISLLLRQPLSIKKSYAGAIQSVCIQGDTDITIPTDVPPGRREVAVNKSVENGGLGISIKGTHRLRFIQ
jgi:hypothetical protein